MFATIDIRKSALTLFAAAVLSTAAGIVSSASASPLAASSHFAAASLRAIDEYGTHEGATRNEHRLTRPANRFNGFVGEPGPKTGSVAAQ